MMSLPLITSFGLLFKDKLQMLSMPATDISMIININSAFGMSMGLFTGPLLKNFGYRKIACAASFMFATGIVMTAFATTFTHFIITYSLITGNHIKKNRKIVNILMNLKIIFIKFENFVKLNN